MWSDQLDEMATEVTRLERIAATDDIEVHNRRREDGIETVVTLVYSTEMEDTE